MMQFFFFLMGGLIMVMWVKDFMMKKLYTQSLMFLLSVLIMNNKVEEFFSCISVNLGVDDYAFPFLVMVSWILGLIVMSLKKEYKMNLLMYLIIGLMFNMMFLFCSMNFMMFYLFFEMSMVPMIFIIVTWGYSKNRFLAMLYMFFYTMVFSIPLMVYLIYMHMKLNSMNYDILVMYKLKNNYSYYMSSILMTPFLVKLPMYTMHGWLPKAHVEAPLIGSMFLAGVLLKLGGYGLIRILFMFENMLKDYLLSLIILGLVGGLFLSVQCLIQSDMKVLVAYSSVVHMSLVLGGLLSLDEYSFMGSMIMMIGHGLCSSAMFYLVNVSYKLTNSRSLLLNKGMIYYDAKMTMMWFLIIICNVSVPFSLNMFGELFLLFGLYSVSIFLGIIIGFMMLFSFCYTLHLYMSTQFGEFEYNWYNKCKVKMIDYMNLLLHWFPLMFIFLVMDYFF